MARLALIASGLMSVVFMSRRRAKEDASEYNKPTTIIVPGFRSNW